MTLSSLDLINTTRDKVFHSTRSRQSQNMTMQSTQEEPSSVRQEASLDDPSTLPVVRFVVTGFGPFGAVKENPTTIIVKKLRAFLNDELGDDRRTVLARSIDDCIILETSAQGVKDLCKELQMEMSKDRQSGSTAKRILLHLGVAETSNSFRLEACSYNQATFRIPDVRGYKPMNISIVEQEEYGACMRTSVDVEHLARVMTERFPEISTQISTDPGRYVCNYVYCSTLRQFGGISDQSSSKDQSTCCCSLFLHVPPFEVVPEKQQLDYVAFLLETLAEVEGKT